MAEEDTKQSIEKNFGIGISAPFINRPVATTLLTLAIAFVGMLAYKLLPIAPLPDMDLPVVIARASMPGASPETMAATVATPLERALGKIAGVNEITSSSSLGSSNVVLQFDLDRDINGAASDVQSAINASRSTLPTMPSNPSYRKINPAEIPILTLSLSSEMIERHQLYDLASTKIAPKISQIPGVGEVSISGAASPSVRIEIIPDAVNRLGLSMDDIRKTIQNANAFMPKGIFENDRHYWVVGASDQLFQPDDYKSIIVAYKNGHTIRLSDIAKVISASEDRRNMAMVNGRPVILLRISKSPGANIVQTIDLIKQEIDKLSADLQNDLTINIRTDRSLSIRASLKEVEKSLIISIVLVILVTFIFLRNARAVTIPAVAAPVSILGTFAVMYLCGYSLNIISLMALTVATGFVVDDAIVVMENIARHIELGESPWHAAMYGSKEVAFTVISITISLITVFAPIILTGGIIGRFIREFGVVITAAITISMIISLTTTPMMCAKFLRPIDKSSKEKINTKQQQEGLSFFNNILAKIDIAWEKGLHYIQDSYANTLAITLRYRKLMIWILIIAIVCNVWLFIIIPKGFIPEQDMGQIIGSMRADQSSSYQAIAAKMEKILEIIRNDPDVEQVEGHISGARAGGSIFINPKPQKNRNGNVQDVIRRLRPKINKEAGLQVFLTPFQEIRMGGRSSRANYQYTLMADNLQDLRKYSKELQNAMIENPVFKDVNSDMEEKGLQTRLNVDRDRLAKYGLTMRDVVSALGNAFSQKQISTIYHDANQYRVILEYDQDWLQDVQSLEKIYLKGEHGLVPLLSVASIVPSFAPITVTHDGQFAAVTISFNLASGTAFSDAQKAIDELKTQIGTPRNIIASFRGTASLHKDTANSQVILILAALVTLYIVLGILYESLIHPITILSTLPSAGLGAFLALMLFNMQFDIIALIGILLLAGIVKKNAIMMIDFAIDIQRGKNTSPEQAIYEAALKRFRPIIMTTAAAVMGAIPLALGTGIGAEIRRPLGVTIVGGLLVSQLLTLYSTPSVYIALDHIQQKLAQKWMHIRFGKKKARVIRKFQKMQQNI